MAPKKQLTSAMASKLKADRVATGALVPKVVKGHQLDNTSPDEALYEAALEPFLEGMRAGEPATKVCKRLGLTASKMRSWVWRNHRDEYEKAQVEGADLLAEQAVAEAVDGRLVEETVETTFADGSTTTAVKRSDNVQRSRIASEAMWRMAAAKNPVKYGGKAGQNDTSTIAQELIAARNRVKVNS